MAGQDVRPDADPPLAARRSRRPEDRDAGHEGRAEEGREEGLAEHGPALQAVAPVLPDRSAALPTLAASRGLIRLDDDELRFGTIISLTPFRKSLASLKRTTFSWSPTMSFPFRRPSSLSSQVTSFISAVSLNELSRRFTSSSNASGSKASGTRNPSQSARTLVTARYGCAGKS